MQLPGGAQVNYDVEGFIAENTLLDERAILALRSQTPEVQQRVIQRGSLADCTSQSKALMGRIRDATGSGPGPGAGMDLEQFIVDNAIDQTAANCLRSEQPHIIQQVLVRGSLAKCNNPSAAVLGRVKEAKKLSMGMGMMMPAPPMYQPSVLQQMQAVVQPDAAAMMMQQDHAAMMMQVQTMSQGVQPGEVDLFCQMYQIDERAAQALKDEDPSIQRAVIDRGDMAGCTNPSATVLGRIKSARKLGGLAAIPGVFSAKGGKGGRSATSEEIEAFLRENKIDDMGRQQFMAESPEVQTSVMARGGLLSCRNPSAALLGRLGEAKRMLLSSPFRASPY
eukprot:gnl/TRDRNA2_/TRDRNA2_133498_c0_seq2.p1 gnl/TRDRNA2_/TRDRNA2_133498_c0~~gnl/TRDRNA2_/TRDRNA2_133498_c0_seq2.p1  ORF type:complete len:336 (-),score=66.44 gnl/TRDRNA2_/TRDRNA2_133498_c0_seq2:81-1088(-)